MTHSIDLIVFDLDGTLVDSLPDLAAAANSALRRLGLPEHPLEAHQKMIGGGEKNYVRRFLGPDHQHLFDQALSYYLEHYSQHLGDRTRQYAGVTETLTRLSPRKMAVLSNKREDLSRQVVQVMGIAMVCSNPPRRASTPSFKNCKENRPGPSWSGISRRTSWRAGEPGSIPPQ